MEQLNPKSRPFICMNTGNKAKFVNCCKDGDYCNRHVNPPPKEVGRYDSVVFPHSSFYTCPPQPSGYSSGSPESAFFFFLLFIKGLPFSLEEYFSETESCEGGINLLKNLFHSLVIQLLFLRKENPT